MERWLFSLERRTRQTHGHRNTSQDVSVQETENLRETGLSNKENLLLRELKNIAVG